MAYNRLSSAGSGRRFSSAGLAGMLYRDYRRHRVTGTRSAVGVVLLGLNIFFGGKINFTLPLVFLMLGSAFIILVFVFARQWAWAAVLYIPGCILLALGLIFLLNVITNDWNSWAYAWLLILSGLGSGLMLASRSLNWRKQFSQAGIGLAVLTLIVAAGCLIFQALPLAVQMLENHVLRLRKAAAAGETVVYGDGARREALIAAGLARASALVISFADTPAAINPAAPAFGDPQGMSFKRQPGLRGGPCVLPIESRRPDGHPAVAAAPRGRSAGGRGAAALADPGCRRPTGKPALEVAKLDRPLAS